VSQADPGAGAGRLLLEKVRLILVLMVMDLKRLHGLVRLIVLMLFFIIVFSILIGFAGDIMEQVGTPTWTGDILEGDGPGGVEPLTISMEADTYIGPAPLAVNVTPTVEHAEGDASYRWYVDAEDEDAQPVSREAGTFSWTFNDMNMHTIGLVVEDERGEADPVRLWVNVLDPMDPNMQAIVVANETEGPSPLDVAFSVQTYGGLPPYTFAWTFGDGSTSDQRNPTHTFEADGEQEFRVAVVVTDRTGNMTPEMEQYVEITEDEDTTLGFTLLDFVYGYCVMVCVVMVPVAFTAAYRKELVRGTVRTIVCYPVGPLDITLAKLLYCFIICLPFTLVAFILPVQGLGKEGGDYVRIFVMTFILTIVTMTIGALAALAATKVTGRMWFRPHTVAFGAVMLAYVGTTRMLGLIGIVMDRVTGMGQDYLADTFAPLVGISPFHLGGELLGASLGGTTDVNPAVLIIPVLMLVGLGWMSTRVYPSIFEKE
jgi:PKD repeat protein